MSEIAKELGFIILCPQRNHGGLRCTAQSIQSLFPDSHALSVVGEDAHDSELKEFNREVRTVRAGKTITSLMNKGLSESRSKWNFMIMAGTRMKHGVMKKFMYFAKDERCILYPVVDRKWAFDEASINGIMLHKAAFEDIGPFAEKENDIDLVKLFWAMEAIEKGYCFRAIVGGRLV